jgi:hypothetical protein
MEIMAMAAAEGFGDPANPTLGPDGIWDVSTVYSSLFYLSNNNIKVRATNEALFALTIDDETGVIELLKGHFGRVTGGAVTEVNGHKILTDPNAVYSWLRADEVDPPEVAQIQPMLWGHFAGPSNTMDRYYASLWDLDLLVAEYNHFETGGTWRDRYFQMRTSEVDAPVYAVASSLVTTSGEYEVYRDQLAPVRGSGGLPRTEAGFRVMNFPEWDHLDVTFLYPENNVLYPDLVKWLEDNSSGKIQIPRL